MLIQGTDRIKCSDPRASTLTAVKHQQKSALEWASVSRRSPRGPGWGLGCLGHFPHSCLRHPCVQTEPGETSQLVKQMLRFMKRSRSWVLLGDSQGEAWPAASQAKTGDLPSSCQHTCHHCVTSLLALSMLFPSLISGGLWKGGGNEARLELALWSKTCWVKGLQAQDTLPPWKQTVT